jgi:polar amino acid transport system substrate-binding protein
MRHITAAILLNIAFIQSAFAVHEKPLTVCWEANLKPPYLQLDENNSLSGIAVDWIEHILDAQQIPFVHVIKPWKRCLQDVKLGKADIVPNSSFKLNRSEFALYSRPIYTTRLKFFYLEGKIKNSQIPQSLNDFKRYKVGGVGGYNYDFYQQKLTIDTGANSRTALLKKLQRNRIDFAIMQEQVLYSLLKNEPEQLKALGQIDAPLKPLKNYHILVSKKNHQAAEILHIINSGFSILRASSNYQRIIDKYLPKRISALTNNHNYR